VTLVWRLHVNRLAIATAVVEACGRPIMMPGMDPSTPSTGVLEFVTTAAAAKGGGQRW
jgi:hypothetical protein